MENVRAFEGFPKLAEIQRYLLDQKKPLETSELYSSAQDSKIINPELRKSGFRVFQDEEIFGLVDEVIQWLNNSDDNYSYQLRRDNITETRYEQDGHFLKHKDFLSVTSNLIEEFTLILCVTPQQLSTSVVGGETIIFPYASEKGTPFDTVTPGKGLLFRKDLDHAGGLLKAGEKHILTANIWATRKQTSDQVLFVTFPQRKGNGIDDDIPKAEAAASANSKEAATATAVSSLQQVANQETSYALPADCLKGSMLEAHVRFVNRSYERQGLEEPKVVAYECNEFSFEEFGTVAKILLRSYVDEDRIRDHAHAIDFFGPFPPEKLLVNLALVQKSTDSEQEAATCERLNVVKPSNKKLKTTGLDKSYKDDSQEELEDMDVIVCENESRTKVVSEVAKLLGIDTYVPFKMIFVEGMVANGYFDSFNDVPVTPVALVLGDYNHVFGFQKFEIEDNLAPTISDMHTKHLYDVDRVGSLFNPEEEYDDEWEYEMDYQAEYDFFSQCRGLGLKVALGESDASRKLIDAISDCSSGEGFFGHCNSGMFDHMEHYLDKSDKEDESDKEEEEEKDGNTNGGNNEACTQTLFHRDSKGKVTFTKEEAAATSTLIASMNLDGRVKASLQKKRFEIPQETEEYNEYYCNESTYANMSILLVTGLVKLDRNNSDDDDDDDDVGDKKPSGSQPPFDAWPTKEQRNERIALASNTFSGMGIPMPPLPDYYYESDDEADY